MEISAKIILCSKAPQHDHKITTLLLTYPRFIHAEAKTHRILSAGNDRVELIQDVSLMSDPNLSRNAMSSRAVPVAKMIEQVRTSPAMPIHWGANQPGMQAHTELADADRDMAIYYWEAAAKKAAELAEDMNGLGLHKQVVNRILEPFQWMHTIVTATEWENFFSLRLHKDAEPNMRRLAEVMLDAFGQADLVERELHVPFVTQAELAEYGGQTASMISAARCARVSYLNHDGSAPDVMKDLALAQMLRDSRHASPFEHQATALADPIAPSRNFFGWEQFRESISL